MNLKFIYNMNTKFTTNGGYNMNILHSLFLDNPALDEALARFCRSDPAYLRARAEYEQMAAKLEQLLGYEGYCAYEECLNTYEARAERACYLFGLGLREEVLRGLG